MNEVKAREYAEWLDGRCKVQLSDIIPVKVYIKKLEFFGVLYTCEIPYQATERAVTEGLVKTGEIYQRHCFSLLGVIPKLFQKKYALVWKHNLKLDERVEVSIGEWYLAGWYQLFGTHDGQKFDEYHFDNAFNLHEWTINVAGANKDIKIDSYERKPRERIPMNVEFIR